MPPTLRVWTALVTVYVVWGSTYLGIRYAVGADTGQAGFPPLLMAGVRYLLAGVALFLWARRRPASDGRPDPLGWPQWRATAIVGTALLLGGNGLVTVAEHRGLDSGIAAVLVATVPIWVALIGFVRGTDRLPLRSVAGLVLGFAGVVVLFDPGGAKGDDMVGSALILAAAATWAGGSYWARDAPMPRRPLVMTGMQMLCGGAALLLASLVTGDAFDLRLGEVGWSAWAGFVYLVLFGSLVAFTAYAWLVRNARLSLVTTYAFVNPVVAVALGARPPRREPLTARTLLASGIIVAGVGLIVLTRREAAPSGEEAGPLAVPDLAAACRDPE